MIKTWERPPHLVMKTNQPLFSLSAIHTCFIINGVSYTLTSAKIKDDTDGTLYYEYDFIDSERLDDT